MVQWAYLFTGILQCDLVQNFANFCVYLIWVKIGKISTYLQTPENFPQIKFIIILLSGKELIVWHLTESFITNNPLGHTSDKILKNRYLRVQIIFFTISIRQMQKKKPMTSAIFFIFISKFSISICCTAPISHLKLVYKPLIPEAFCISNFDKNAWDVVCNIPTNRVISSSCTSTNWTLWD